MRKRLHLYLVFLLIFSALLIVVGYTVFVIRDIPSVRVLKNLENKPVSTIYGRNDEVFCLIVPDNRVFVTYNRIPGYVKDAFVAAEDADFFKHRGLEVESIIRALYKNIVHGRVVQGGSTITQQVIKTLILGPERSILRKVREAVLAYKLETYLTKKEILNLYLNNIYMGHGVYGVEAAAQVYFGKHIWEVTRAEAALLAGIVQAPTRYTPKKHPGSARMRQEYVIRQMHEKGLIDEKKQRDMLKEKMVIRESHGVFTDSYFKDHIVQYVEDRLGKGIFSRQALKVYATVDPPLQRLAEESVKRGLSLYEQRKGDYTLLYHLDRGKWDNFLKTGDRDLKVSGFVQGKTYSLLVSEKMKDGYTVLAGSEKGFMAMTAFPFRPGDVIKGTYTGQDKKKVHQFQPVRSLKVEGALICLEASTGYVLAMMGGRDFEKSPYNRALAAKLQSGSAFKPFIYVTALKKGFEPDTMIVDEPKDYSMGDGRTWTPRNYDGKYEGSISMRDAVAYSKNAATVRLLEEVGVTAVKETLQELGITTEVEHNLSIALGTSNMTLLDLTKGFAAFANGGYRIKPLFVRRITDAQGQVMDEAAIEKTKVLSDETAFKINLLLKGPVDYGTAKGVASRIGYPVAGKTGTTSNYYDALFVGYSPHIVSGVWVGFDTRTSLGKGESGARVCLPIWMNFMASAVRRYPPDDFPGPAAPPVLNPTF